MEIIISILDLFHRILGSRHNRMIAFSFSHRWFRETISLVPHMGETDGLCVFLV